MKFSDGTLTIRGAEIPTRTGMVKQNQLRFYPENPRIYSVLRSEGEDPTQDEIQSRLQAQEHVKHLVQDIAANGGLTDPLVVLDESWVVLEGNSRLAAYRALAEKDPIRWGEAKCTILPKDTEEKQIFALLGQYHLKGKKDWVPFEQAGFLYRRYKKHGMTISALAGEVGVSKPKVSRYIETYQFMLDHGESQLSRWSYYEEYIKSRKLKKLRKEHSDFDEVVVKKIKTGEIQKAVEVRDTLPLLERATKKIITRFLDGALDLEGAVEAVEATGNTNATYTKLEKFRQWLASEDTHDAVFRAKGQAKNKLSFELGKLSKVTAQLKRRLDKKTKS